MKKAIKVVIAVMLICLCCIPAFASDNHTTGDLSNVEIIPPDNSGFTDIQKQNVINHLKGNENTIGTFGLLCTFLGHDFSVEVWTVTEHNYYSSVPKCHRSYYDVTVCSRCDYVSSTLISSARFPCCD